MRLCRFYLPDQGARLGHWVGEEIYDLTATGQPHFATLTSLLQASARRIIATLLQDVDLPALPSYACADLDRAPAPDVPHLLPPVDRQEVWAAGVTYTRSREARVREAVNQDVYERV